MESIDIQQQKEIQVEILKEVRNFCDEHNLTYFLGGGTLLGAIRHKGYIPWDDDIDIMMPRADYEKLLTEFNETCNNQYKLISYKNTEDYYYIFAKVVNTQTILVEDNYKKIKDLGIYIDIFPIDYLPDDENETKKIMKQYRKMHKITSMYSVDKLEEVTKSKSKLIMKKLILSVVNKKDRYKNLLQKMDSLASSYKDTNTVACVSGRYFEKEIMPSTYIAETIYADFEGEKYKIPAGYDAYLTKHYGNYMELPPEEKRTKEHHNEAYWKK